MCVSTVKPSMAVYFTLLYTFIFCPLICIFLWFYYKIAALIWRHRKPVQSHHGDKAVEESESNTRTTEITTTAEPKPKPKEIKKNKNVQVERKIRTFKIVITLMLSFLLCRIPYFTQYMYKLCRFESNGKHNHVTWNINYALLSMNCLNCALNPLLYTFINETINVCKKICDFTYKIACCFCITSEFDDFERDRHPVVAQYLDHRKLKETTGEVKNSKVRFKDVPPVEGVSSKSSQTHRY